MSDKSTLVQDLRDFRTSDEIYYEIEHQICYEAANEIEFLRGLLKKYMTHVGDEGGRVFMPRKGESGMTETEVAYLQRIDAAILAERGAADPYAAGEY